MAALADPYGFTVFTVAFSPDGRTLAAGDYQGSTCLWDARTRHLIATLNDPECSGVNSAAFSPDGRPLAAPRIGPVDRASMSSGRGRRLKRWRQATGRRVAGDSPDIRLYERSPGMTRPFRFGVVERGD